MRTVEIAPTFEAWQVTARALVREGVPPAEVMWRETAEQTRLYAMLRADLRLIAAA